VKGASPIALNEYGDDAVAILFILSVLLLVAFAVFAVVVSPLFFVPVLGTLAFAGYLSSRSA